MSKITQLWKVTIHAPPVRCPQAEAGASEPIDLETGRIERIKAMEALLVYRAVLVATLLAMAIGTSDLLQLKNRNQIVQVL